jgi:myosin heavy subunit
LPQGIAGVNDAQDFDDLRVALERVGIDYEVQSAVWALVAAVLWLGNVEFLALEDDSVAVKQGKALGYAAELLQVGGHGLPLICRCSRLWAMP